MAGLFKNPRKIFNSIVSGGGGASLSGTTNYVAKFTSATEVGDSQIFDDGTNVGIGTSSPNYKLDVLGRFINIKPTGAEYSAGYLLQTDSSVYKGGVIHATEPTSQIYGYTNIQSAGGNPLVLSTDGELQSNGSSPIIFSIGGYYLSSLEKMRLNNTGLGIGTTNPTAKLSIQGVDATSSNYALKINDGAGSPNPLLWIRNDGFTQLQGLNIGKGRNAVTGNTAFGFNCLASASLSGVDNTAMGYESLVNVTTGIGNASFGKNNLTAMQTGSYNIAIGRNVLYNATSGSMNIGLGVNTLVATNGTGNVAVGNNSGQVTTGSRNVFVGAYSGQYSTASNKLIIDSSSSGRTDEATELANSLIVGDFAAAPSSQVLYFNAQKISTRYLPTYADNAAATGGGLVAGDIYQTATGELRITV